MNELDSARYRHMPVLCSLGPWVHVVFPLKSSSLLPQSAATLTISSTPSLTGPL